MPFLLVRLGGSADESHEYQRSGGNTMAKTGGGFAGGANIQLGNFDEELAFGIHPETSTDAFGISIAESGAVHSTGIVVAPRCRLHFLSPSRRDWVTRLARDS
jgi:hypothetical protein